MSGISAGRRATRWVGGHLAGVAALGGLLGVICRIVVGVPLAGLPLWVRLAGSRRSRRVLLDELRDVGVGRPWPRSQPVNPTAANPAASRPTRPELGRSGGLGART